VLCWQALNGCNLGEPRRQANARCCFPIVPAARYITGVPCLGRKSHRQPVLACHLGDFQDAGAGSSTTFRLLQADQMCLEADQEMRASQQIQTSFILLHHPRRAGGGRLLCRHAFRWPGYHNTNLAKVSRSRKPHLVYDHVPVQALSVRGRL
jgi:hypothetical protein